MIQCDLLQANSCALTASLRDLTNGSLEELHDVGQVHNPCNGGLQPLLLARLTLGLQVALKEAYEQNRSLQRHHRLISNPLQAGWIVQGLACEALDWQGCKRLETSSRSQLAAVGSTCMHPQNETYHITLFLNACHKVALRNERSRTTVCPQKSNLQHTALARCQAIWES